MNLVIDIGNSRAKLYVYDNNQLIHNLTTQSINIETLNSIKNTYKIDKVIISSTKDMDVSLVDWFKLSTSFLIVFNPSLTSMPIGNKYKTPQTLGSDRLAAAVGANSLFPSKSIMIFDFGTAITIDFVENNTYLGGNISLGLNSRFKALNNITDKLPLCKPSIIKDISVSCSLVGQSTTTAIEYGVMQSVVYEIDGYIKNNRDKIIFFTGGDAKYFENLFKNTIFADYELVSKGLNHILEYNYTSQDINSQ